MLRILLMCLALALVSGSGIVAAECPLVLEEPILITSVGQSIDALIIKTIFDDMGVRADFQPLFQADGVEHYGQIVISSGISYKGIAAAGTTLESEVERAKAIVEAAQAQSVPLILMYLGGFIQGDANSQKLLDILTPHVDVIIVYRDSRGPLDYFTNLAEEQRIPLFFLADMGNLCEEVTLIFSP